MNRPILIIILQAKNHISAENKVITSKNKSHLNNFKKQFLDILKKSSSNRIKRIKGTTKTFAVNYNEPCLFSACYTLNIFVRKFLLPLLKSPIKNKRLVEIMRGKIAK